MDELINIKPIIGLKETVFGYIIDGSYNKPHRFVFCDENKDEITYEIDGHIILSVHEHYYSFCLSSETKNIIIVNSDHTLVTIGGSHIKKKCILDLLPIGNTGLAFTASTIVKEDKFGNKPYCFHPICYLSLDSPKILDLNEKRIKKNTAYLFSMMGLHFVVDWTSDGVKDPDHFTYHLIDQYGNIVFTWNKENQIRCIWRRENGSFSIYSTSEYVENLYDSNTGTVYENKDNRKLQILCISDSYARLSYDHYKKKIEEESLSREKTNELRGLLDGDGEEIPEITASFEDFLEWRKEKSIKNKTFIIKSDYIKSLEKIVKDRVASSNSVYCSDLFCDNDYLIIKFTSGFCSFNTTDLLATNDLSNFILINKWEDYEPIITDCKYGNGLFGLQLVKSYTGEYPTDDDNYNYDECIGDYRLYDIYGNSVGVLYKDLLVTPINSIGSHQFCGIVNETDFSLIIPPIFKEIKQLDRYRVENKIGHKGYNGIVYDGDVQEKYLYEYDFLGHIMGVLEDKKLYIVSQELGIGGRMQYGIFENEQELVSIGDNEIKRVSGQYVLVKNDDQSLYTLLFHSGKVLFEKVRDVEVMNIYNVEISGNISWKRSEIVPLLHFAKVYLEKGFLLVVDDRQLIDDILLDLIPVSYTSTDVFYKATLLSGDQILLSIKTGILVSGIEYNITEINNSFVEPQTSPYGTSYSYVSHIIKSGDEFSDDMKYQINHDLWDYSTDPSVYLDFSADDALLVYENDSYKIVYNNRMHETSLDENSEFYELEKAFRIDPATIVEDVSFIGSKNSLENNKPVLQIMTSDERVGYYLIDKGWLVQPEPVALLEQFDDYLVFNSCIITKNGSIKMLKSNLELISKANQISAYFDSSEQNYIIIDCDGKIFLNLQKENDNILVSNELDNYHKYQLCLNTNTKQLHKNVNPDHKERKKHSTTSYESYEWTDEDSWDAMTDGQYGDYPGSGWDPEHFGY